MKTKLFIIFLLVTLIAMGGFPVYAQDSSVEVKSVNIENQFPDGLLFKVSAEIAPPDNIVEIKLQIKVSGSNRSSYAYLDFTPGTAVQGSYLLRTGGALYKPPGIMLEYYFVITDSSGKSLETLKDTYLYIDNRFEWNRLSRDMVEVLYYGSTEAQAEIILDSAVETIDRMGSLLGIKPSEPIRILAYSNYRDMSGALQFESETTQRELVTAGQAWYDYKILLVLGDDTRVDGLVSHEMTHMLESMAARSFLVNLPMWLSEGMAEYGNINQGVEYDEALARAIDENRVPPLRNAQSTPGKSEDIILVYGLGKAVVKYMVDTYGADKLRALFDAFARGNRIDNALKSAYGFDQDGLDNAWRKTINLPAVEPASQVSQTEVPAIQPEPEPQPDPVRKPIFSCAGP